MAITIEDVTTGVLAGTGAFDKMMATINVNLTEQFENGRITGAEFATVYLGSLQSALEQAIQFLSVQSNVEISESQSAQDLAIKQTQQELTEQQVLTEFQNTILVRQKAITEWANTLKESIADTFETSATILPGGLAAAQLAKSIAESTLLVNKTLTEAQATISETNKGNLYLFQTNSFKHKSAHDVLRVYADLWNIGTAQGVAESIPDYTSVTSSATSVSSILVKLMAQMFENASEDDPKYDFDVTNTALPLTPS